MSVGGSAAHAAGPSSIRTEGAILGVYVGTCPARRLPSATPSDLRHRRTGIQSTQGVRKCLGFQQCAEVVGDGGPSVGADGGDLKPFGASTRSTAGSSDFVRGHVATIAWERRRCTDLRNGGTGMKFLRSSGGHRGGVSQCSGSSHLPVAKTQHRPALRWPAHRSTSRVPA